MIRVERSKRIRNFLNFYKNSFGMHPPYLIICDGNFVFAALDMHIDLLESFNDICRGKVYLKVPDCILTELNSFTDPHFDQLKRFVREHCQKFHCAHQPKNPHQCIADTLRRGFNGAVATQDEDLRRLIHRDYERVPVFFIGQYLQISPPPKSLRNKVQAELTEKYSAKNVIRPPEPADLIKDDNDED